MDQKKTEKLTEKAFAHLALTAILGILVCIVCLSATTYAWFTTSVQSSSNEIRAAGECRLAVTVYRDGAAVASLAANGEDSTSLAVMPGEYTVTLELPAGSASGYLLVTAEGESYRSDCLMRDESAGSTLSFTLSVATERTLVLTARWGIVAGDSAVDGGVMRID